MKTSLNPFAYRPAEIAKALAALLTAAITVLGLIAMALTTGGLSTAAAWIAGIAAALTPPLVFLKRAESVIDIVEPARPDTETA